MIASSGLGESADPPYLRVSPRFWLARRATIAITTALLALCALLCFALSMAAGWIAEGVVVAGGITMWCVERGRYRAWGYAERGDDFVVTQGLLFRKTSVVPYGRMQFIDVKAGPVERAFGIATVQMHTAAAASDAKVPGLEREEATRLRDRLAAIGTARSIGL